MRSVAAELPGAVGIELDVRDERIVAVDFERWLRDRNGRR